ncbi:MAG: FAD-dependent monooxygenase [Candidatus Hodarchaeales archaeon]|jgi:flavin-dependent dehydrogenase
MKEVEIVVVGAGTTGSVVAAHLGQQGYRVLLLDRKRKAKIGQKVCGNGLGTDHLRHLHHDGLISSVDALVNSLPAAVTIRSQDYNATFSLKNSLAIINRDALGTELLESAEEVVSVWDQCKVKTIKKTTKKSIQLQTTTGTITAQYCIDAAGFRSPLQPYRYAAGEAYACYRAYLPAMSSHDPAMHFLFSIAKTGGGYIWDFPQDDVTRNVGLGVPKGKGLSPARQLTAIYGKPLNGQGGHVPTRRPFPSLFTYPRLLHIGDAGNTVNPWHGGGLSPGIELARYIGAQGLQLDEFPAQNAERINRFFWKTYGKRYAFLDLFRVLLQQIPNDQALGSFFRRLPLKALFFAKSADELHSILQMVDFDDNPWLSKLQQTAEQLMTHLKPVSTESPSSFNWRSLAYWQIYEQIYVDYQRDLQQLKEH